MQIKNILLFIILATHCNHHSTLKQSIEPFIIVIDPAGDAKKTGRHIFDCFERGITLQCAEKIKSLVEARNPFIHVIISRLPGDVVHELQSASLANRCAAKLFLSLNFYQTDDTKPTLFLYNFSYGHDFAQTDNYLSFKPYYHAYKNNCYLTNNVIKLCKEQLGEQNNQTLFFIEGPYTLPLKPLIGITAPALLIETGLKHKNSWTHYVEPISHMILFIFDQWNILHEQ